MKVSRAIAEILKLEGVEFIVGYPVNPIIEAAAAAGVQLRGLVPSRLSLEDAFLAAMAPEAPEPGAAHANP